MLVSAFARRSAPTFSNTLRSISCWSAVPAGPPDPILGIYYPYYYPEAHNKISKCRGHRSLQGGQGPAENQLGCGRVQRRKRQALRP